MLALKGEGVLVGIIDTGVDYTNPLFRYSDGSSRILRIWDQTVQDGTPPEGILYGAEYRKEEIDEALQAERPYDVVPSRDENGHGTFVTGVVCGGEDIPNGFIGAVPNAGIAVVKLKEAKRYLSSMPIRFSLRSAGIFLRAGGSACLSGDGPDDGGILFK